MEIIKRIKPKYELVKTGEQEETIYLVNNYHFTDKIKAENYEK